jgi:hypothetical protein
VRVKVSYFYKSLKIFSNFSRENHGHGGHEHGVQSGVFGGKLSFKNMSAGVAAVLCKKISIFGSRRSKLDHLTVYREMLSCVPTAYTLYPPPIDIYVLIVFDVLGPSGLYSINAYQSPYGL